MYEHNICTYTYTHIHNEKAYFNKISGSMLNDCSAPLTRLCCTYENNNIVQKLLNHMFILSFFLSIPYGDKAETSGHSELMAQEQEGADSRETPSK